MDNTCGVNVSRAGVNGLLIDWFKQASDQPLLQSQILRLLQITGAYSISGKVFCFLLHAHYDRKKNQCGIAAGSAFGDAAGSDCIKLSTKTKRADVAGPI